MLTAISGSPLRYAISELRNVYLITFIFACLLVITLRRLVKRNLIQPLEAVNAGFTDGRQRIMSPDDKPLKWREPFDIIEHYTKTQDKLRADKNELTRLNTVLEYANKAERDRRQMTSNIAHELKTPLAVIHSYSEGLKERIAEDKREQYLAVIIAESERMDSMVIEMLDLSRLEAGKVKLARDEFSLSELVQSVFEKLDIVVDNEGLKVSYDFEENCIVDADEARINQAVTNLASNAVKYAPYGSAIHVKTFSERGKTGFSVENDSEPLTNEDLSKVWETFYRADNARTDEGAGLGLAIAKSIIDLHGGICYARNTKTGVEFGFVI